MNYIELISDGVQLLDFIHGVENVGSYRSKMLLDQLNMHHFFKEALHHGLDLLTERKPLTRETVPPLVLYVI
jgi:hypothetical protein